jgi:hypothetical protein
LTSASGPSHFGMYIVGSNDPLIATLDATMWEIPYSTGLLYKWWYRCLNAQILKKLGVWIIKKLQTILLLEANFNMNNKKLRRDAMYFAECCQALTKEQYRGRKNHRAAELALNAKLVNDIFYQTKCTGVVCSNDAQSCFDRIIHSVCSLSLQRLGMPLAPIISKLTTLQNLTHFVWTAFGDSDTAGLRKTKSINLHARPQSGQWCWTSMMDRHEHSPHENDARRRILIFWLDGTNIKVSGQICLLFLYQWHGPGTHKSKPWRKRTWCLTLNAKCVRSLGRRYTSWCQPS